MANREHGEVDFEADGKTYTLRLDVNAMIQAQAAAGIKDDMEFWGIISLKLAYSLVLLRALVGRGLKASEPKISDVEVGDLITRLGTYRTVEIVSEALRWALPPKKEAAATDKAAGEEPRPSDGPTSS